MSRHAVLFLDRDGVLNEKAPDGAYILSPDGLRILPGVGRALRRLRAEVPGLRVAVVTNQRAIALGLLTSSTLEAIHIRLRDGLAAEGARIERIEVCPHDVGECSCRKPGTGMLDRVFEAWSDADPARSAMVGDSAIDVRAGQRAGMRTYLVGEPARRSAEASRASAEGFPPDEQADSLIELVDDGRLVDWLRDGTVATAGPDSLRVDRLSP